MDFISMIFIGFGLSMDAFAVSVSCGFSIPEIKKHHAFRIASVFGLFQAVMPVIGWAIASRFRSILTAWDHWIAFGLLLLIGAHMLYESHVGCPTKRPDPLQWRILLLLGVATSIDALAVGLSFAFLNSPIVIPVLIIGVITFGMALTGIKLGDKLGCHLSQKAEIIGALILIGIGLKILIEHLFFQG